MKLASYIKNGNASYGVVTDDGIIDLGEPLGNRFVDLKSLLAGGMKEAAAFATSNAADTQFEDVQLQPVIPNPGVIWAAGMNTHSHYVEAKDAMGLEEVPKVPMFFLRAINTLVASGEALEKPLKEPAFDYEGEIALIIGKRCRNVSVEDALDYVAGYAPFNDGSARFYQISSKQLTTGKNAYRSGGFGPCMATADSLDINEMELTTRVNGEQRQAMKIDDLIFSFAELVSHISEINWLEPGDVIVTGSAEGAGALRDPRIFLAPGDTVEVEVSGIGTLVNGIVEQVIE
jgi:2-keto-4-pentenoate hydratase/2-oxohepta-3-ene-1,7-dioic acid hydratase in catechol pathway